ncbi:MAG TPA: metallophosphoesterase [Saprospiraceae bacterium]|nr:metallophosphoesterase [Saprospiraceae bacterium]
MSFRASVSLLAILFSSCATGKLYINGANDVQSEVNNEKPIYTIYALGDAGENNTQSKAVLNALADQTGDDTQPGLVIFLGDNIYPAGLSLPSETGERQYGETLLKSQVDALSSYRGEIVFIPGNHDWNEFKAGGLEAIKREGEFLQSFGLSDLSLKPTDGCGGPFVKELTRDAVLLIIDSQWWIQDWDKEPKMNEGCAIQSRDAMIARLKELFEQYHDRQILIAMHHPLESRGPHGGYFSFRDHIFPLSKVADWLYIPLPVIGSLYPWSRQILGHPQDENGKAYKEMKEAIFEIALDQQIIFLCGHDHNLQYVKHAGQDILVSGSGSKQNPLADGEELVFGHKAAGFMRLDFYSQGAIDLSVFEVDVKVRTTQVVYKTKLREGKS